MRASCLGQTSFVSLTGDFNIIILDQMKLHSFRDGASKNISGERQGSTKRGEECMRWTPRGVRWREECDAAMKAGSCEADTLRKEPQANSATKTMEAKWCNNITKCSPK